MGVFTLEFLNWSSVQSSVYVLWTSLNPRQRVLLARIACISSMRAIATDEAWSVRVSHTVEPCTNGWTDRELVWDVLSCTGVCMYVWDMDWRGPKETHITWFQIPKRGGSFLEDDMPMPTHCPLKKIDSTGREDEDGCDSDTGCRYHCRSNFFQSE